MAEELATANEVSTVIDPCVKWHWRKWGSNRPGKKERAGEEFCAEWWQVSGGLQCGQ